MIKSDGVEQEVSQEEMEKMKVTLILWNRMTEVEETDEEEERLRKKIKNLKEKLSGQEIGDHREGQEDLRDGRGDRQEGRDHQKTRRDH